MKTDNAVQEVKIASKLREGGRYCSGIMEKMEEVNKIHIAKFVRI